MMNIKDFTDCDYMILRVIITNYLVFENDLLLLK